VCYNKDRRLKVCVKGMELRLKHKIAQGMHVC
jgi:hypothetical protein